MGISERLAYIKGLLEGSGLKFGATEQKLVDALIELLTDMAGTITDMEEDLCELYDGFDALCENLDDLEGDIDYLFDGDDAELRLNENDMLYDVECPNCKEFTCIDEDTLLQGDISCPGCGEKLEFDVDCSEEDKDE